jgi:hypothetical protein
MKIGTDQSVEPGTGFASGSIVTENHSAIKPDTEPLNAVENR